MVACPEEGGREGGVGVGVGSQALACRPVSTLPMPANRGTLPTAGSGAALALGCRGFKPPWVHLPAAASGGSIPVAFGTTAPHIWNGRNPGGGDGKGKRWGWVKERNGSERLGNQQRDWAR